MAEWRTIDSAPRDGTPVLVWGGRHSPKPVIVESDGEWWNTAGRGLRATPTHWMPLPDPPSE